MYKKSLVFVEQKKNVTSLCHICFLLTKFVSSHFFNYILLFLLQGIELTEENEWLRQQVRLVFSQCIEVFN